MKRGTRSIRAAIFVAALAAISGCSASTINTSPTTGDLTLASTEDGPQVLETEEVDGVPLNEEGEVASMPAESELRAGGQTDVVVLDTRQVPNQPGDRVGPRFWAVRNVLNAESTRSSVHELLDPPIRLGEDCS